MRNDEKQTNSDAVLLRIEAVMKDKGISQRKLIQSLNLNRVLLPNGGMGTEDLI